MNSYTLFISSKAEAHISKAYFWYENQQSNLGIRFQIEINEVIAMIKRNPLLFQIRYHNFKNQGIRVAFTKNFPYGIHYTVSENVITILSVFHGKQNSENWHEN